jgi:hypothetical protein
MVALDYGEANKAYEGRASDGGKQFPAIHLDLRRLLPLCGKGTTSESEPKFQR